MKKFLQKSCQWLVMLVAMIVGAATAWADTTTFNVVGVQPQAITQGPVTLTPNGNGWMAYSTSGWYAVDQTAPFTVSCAAGYKVNSVKVYQSWDSFGPKTFTASVSGNTSNSTTAYYLWEGEGTSITFTSSISFTVVFDRVEVSYSAAGPIEKPNFPVEGQAYQLKHNASGLYLNVVKDNDRGTVLGAEAQPLTFTWDATKGGFTIQNDVDLYVGSHSNDWNMSCSLAEYWTVEGTEGAYTLKRTGTAKYLNFDSSTAGSAAFRDKPTGAVFSIEPYVAPTVYSYRVHFTGYPDGEAPNLMYDGLYYGQDDVVRKTNDQLTESDIQVTNIAGYDYDVAISHPQAADAYGAINVAFAQRAVSYFTIPTVAFRKDIDVTYDSDWNEVPTSMYFRVLASDIPGLDSFKYTGNGKQITAQLTAEGAEPRNAYLTIYGSYDGSQASVKSFDLALADKAFSVTFPKGAFEAANGDLSDAFTYSYDPEANRVTYTFNFYNSDTSASVPADLAVVYANNPTGDRYTTGSNYVALYAPSPADFTSLNPYWEIDPQRSNVSGTNINLYFNQQPYKYYVTIEGNENAVVTVKGQDYSNTEAVETYTLLTDTDVTYNDYKGYNVGNTELLQPEDGKGGVIYVSYDAKTTTPATLDTDRTNPAPGTYSLDEREYGFQYFTLYFEEAMSEDVSIAKADIANAGITFRDAEGRDIEFGDNGIKGFANEKYLSFSAKQAITTPGTYTLHIPAGVVVFSEGDTQVLINNEMDLEWTLTAAQYFDVRDYATPTGTKNADESQLLTLTGFEMELTSAQVANTAINKLYQVADGAYRVDLDDPTTYDELTNMVDFVGLIKNGVLQILFTHEYKPTAPTYYTFMVPEGSFTSTDGLMNKAFQLTAYVDPTTYFDYIVTYPTADNAAGPVDHITVELPGSPAGMPALAENGSIYVNGHEYATTELQFDVNAAGETVIILPQDAIVPVGSMFNYNIPAGTVIYYDVESERTISVGRSKSEYNILVTAAPVEYYVHFEGWPFETHAPQVTYNGENYAEKYSIIAADLTVDQLSATDAPGYEYTITIEETSTPRILVTYTKAPNLAAVDLNMYTAADSKDGVSSAVGNPTTDGANIWNTEDSNYGLIKLNSPRPIRKVEIYVRSNASSVFERGQQGDFTVAGNIATWTGNSNALVFASTDDIYVTKLVAYYDADAEIPVDNSVALAKAVGGAVNDINRYVSLDFDANFAGTHSAYSGQTDIPEGVKFCRVNRDGSEEEVTISEFNYWAGSPALSVVLEKSIYTPGVYYLTIPAGTLEFVGAKGNEEVMARWTINNFGFADYEVTGNIAAEDPMQQKIKRISGFTLGLDEETGIVLSEYTGPETAYVYLVGEEGEETAIATTPFVSTKTNRLQLPFGEDDVITEAGTYTFRIPADMVSETGGFSNREYTIRVTVDPFEHLYFTSKFDREMGGFTASISNYCITSEAEGWAEYVANAGEAEEADIVGKTFELSYYDSEAGQRVEQEIEVKEVYFVDDYVYLGFDKVTVPFDTEFSFTFPAGFITFDDVVSNPNTIGGHSITKVYGYDVKYDESVPEDAYLYRNDVLVADGASFGSIEPKESSDFTATPVAGMQAVITVVQPTEEQEGSITLSYETIEPVPFNGQFTLNGTPSNLGEDFLCSLNSITIPAPEGHTFQSADDCVLLIQGNTDTEYTHYESATATISEDGSEVTITLTPAYSTPAFGTGFKLQEGSLFLDNGAPYEGFNCSVSIFPEYAFNIDHTDPADRAAIYNGDLDHIDVYLPAGLSVGYDAELGIEVVGTDYVESFQPSYISNYGAFYRIQLPSSMDLPAGRITVTIPSDMFYYYDYENNNRYVTNAPYTLWLDNYSVAELASTPAAGDVVSLTEIRVKGSKGQLWVADQTDITDKNNVFMFDYATGETVDATVAIENGELVVTPTETLAVGTYALSVKALIGTVESADVAAQSNARALFMFNVVGSTFAFNSYTQPSTYQTLEGFEALETIILNLPYNVEAIDEVDEQTPIQLVLLDAEGNATQEVVGLTYAHASEDERGTPCIQLIGKIPGAAATSPDGKYRVQLNVPAGIVTSSNGRTNEAATFQFSIDTNKYFAVSPNFESWGHVAGPVKTFTLTAAEGVTFTGIASDQDVDRPTIFKGGNYLTWANPVISADGKSVTLTLAEPISAESPNDQYYLVVPAGLFTGTVTTEEGLTFPATSTGIDAWREVFYVDAPAYEYAQINWGDEMQSGDIYAGTASNFQIHFGKSVYCSSEVPAGAVLTDDQGTSYALTSMWSSDDYIFLSSNAISAPGHYTLILPAGAGWFSESEYTQEVRFEFNIVGSFAITDGTFTPADNERVTSLGSFTYTLPEGKTVQSVDVTKVGTSELNNETWQWEFTPFAGLTYEIVGENNQVVFTFAQPFTEAGSVAIKILDGAIVAADGSVSTTNPSPQSTFSVAIDPFPNDINRDGKEDLDDVNAIVDIVLEKEGYQENNSLQKADQNDDNAVTITDVVKYIQKLRETPVGPVDEKDIAL